jgi:hypothetical protein
MLEHHHKTPEQVMELTHVDLVMMQATTTRTSAGGAMALFEWWKNATPQDIYERAIAGD